MLAERAHGVDAVWRLGDGRANRAAIVIDGEHAQLAAAGWPEGIARLGPEQIGSAEAQLDRPRLAGALLHATPHAVFERVHQRLLRRRHGVRHHLHHRRSRTATAALPKSDRDQKRRQRSPRRGSPATPRKQGQQGPGRQQVAERKSRAGCPDLARAAGGDWSGRWRLWQAGDDDVLTAGHAAGVLRWIGPGRRAEVLAVGDQRGGIDQAAGVGSGHAGEHRQRASVALDRAIAHGLGQIVLVAADAEQGADFDAQRQDRSAQVVAGCGLRPGRRVRGIKRGRADAAELIAVVDRQRHRVIGDRRGRQVECMAKQARLKEVIERSAAQPGPSIELQTPIVLGEHEVELSLVLRRQLVDEGLGLVDDVRLKRVFDRSHKRLKQRLDDVGNRDIDPNLLQCVLQAQQPVRHDGIDHRLIVERRDAIRPVGHRLKHHVDLGRTDIEALSAGGGHAQRGVQLGGQGLDGRKVGGQKAIEVIAQLVANLLDGRRQRPALRVLPRGQQRDIREVLGVEIGAGHGAGGAVIRCPQLAVSPSGDLQRGALRGAAVLQVAHRGHDVGCDLLPCLIDARQIDRRQHQVIGDGNVQPLDDGDDRGAGLGRHRGIVFGLGVMAHDLPQRAGRRQIGALQELLGDAVRKLAQAERRRVELEGRLLDHRLGDDVAHDVVVVALAGSGDRRQGEGLAGHEVDVVVGDSVGDAMQEAADGIGPLGIGERLLVELLALHIGLLSDRVRGIGHAGESHVVGPDGPGTKGQRLLDQGPLVVIGEPDIVAAKL